jgi:hypothetical protein
MADQRRGDEYTKDRFHWIDQVVADPKLPASASKVAYVIATSLWRNKGTVTLVTPEITASDNVREAWIGTRDIADKIAMSRFTVMDMVDRLEERGHLQVDRGKRGRGHANHYRLVRKGAHTSLLKGERYKRKGASANLSDCEKVSRQTSRGAPAHLNPSVPSEEIPSEERGAPQARPRRPQSSFKTSSKETENPSEEEVLEGEIIDVGGVAGAPTPNQLQRAVARARRIQMQDGAR